MENKKIIWLIGSNASGKTTQSKLLHQSFSDLGSKKFVHYPFGNKVEVKATIFDNSGHVGYLKNNQCTGTDTISNKESIDATFCFLLNTNLELIVVDGIMATSTWIDIFTQFPAGAIDIYLILLQFNTLEDNLRRIEQRRMFKYGDKDYKELEDKTIKNVGSKFKGFKSMFNKVKDRCQRSIEIDADISAPEIHKQILNFIK